MTVKIDPDPTLKRNLMAFGREFDAGWNSLVDELIKKLDVLPDEIEILQLKEKFGQLRCYIAGGSDDAHDIITEYEHYSEHICEYCGEFYTAKEHLSHGWVKTLCDKCAKKWENGTLYESKWKKFWRLLLYKLTGKYW